MNKIHYAVAISNPGGSQLYLRERQSDDAWSDDLADAILFGSEGAAQAELLDGREYVVLVEEDANGCLMVGTVGHGKAAGTLGSHSGGSAMYEQSLRPSDRIRKLIDAHIREFGDYPSKIGVPDWFLRELHLESARSNTTESLEAELARLVSRPTAFRAGRHMIPIESGPEFLTFP